MGKHKVTFIPGDGIGYEISDATKRVLEATGVEFEWETVQAGTDVIAEFGTPLPQTVLDSIRKNKVAIKGPITTPIGTGFRSVNVALRKELNLYVCLRPCKTYPGVQSRYKDIDLVIVRENTEDLYAGIEYQKGEPQTKELIDFVQRTNKQRLGLDCGISLKPISVAATENIVRYAFEYAIKNERKKVTAIHKANILKYSDGLFLETARSVAKSYPQIEFEDRIVDNTCMQLVQKPEQFDVLVLPNLYGDIISDLCAGLVGGLGVAPGANIGTDCALFEPTHGSAPKYKGQNKANPMAQMLSGVLMLKHIGEESAAVRLEKAISQIIKEGKSVTYDLKADRNDPAAVGTSHVADAIISKLLK